MKEIELVSKRGRREKHFLQEDGSIIAKLYTSDIHFKKNGQYEEIDNSLVKIDDYYKTKNNLFNAYFKQDSVGKILKYEMEDSYLHFEILGCNKTDAVIFNDKSKVCQKIKYYNCFDDIDFEYDVNSTNVKESIIINNKSALTNEIAFKVSTNLKLELLNNTIYAKKDDKVLFEMKAPFMVDSENIINYNNEYQLTLKDGYYELKLALDFGWLTEHGREFPVIIDPTISVNENSDLQDIYISPSDQNGSYNNHAFLSAGVCKNAIDNTIIEPSRTLVKFNLPTIGTGSQIVKATLVLFNYFTISDDGAVVPKRVDVHRITHDWSETTAKWATMHDKYDSRIEASTLCTRSFENIDGQYTLFDSRWDITSLVKKWYTNTPNYGVMLMSHEEVYVDENEPRFFSKDNPFPNLSDENPRLEIQYRNQTGIEDYMDVLSQHFSIGTVYQNTYNGNLISIFKLAELFGSNVNLNLQLIYNTHNVVLDSDYKLFKGFKFNLWQTIRKTTISNNEYLEYLDGDGTLHYFFKDNDEYIHEDNENITITENDNNFILKDGFNNSMTFEKRNNVGYLIKYETASQNYINISYNNNDQIINIKDNNGKEINIVYESNKIVITDSSTSTNINYNNNQILSITSSVHNIRFAYNENNLICKITDTDDCSISYDYYDQIPYKIKQITEYGVDDTLGASMILNYNNSNTSIMNNKNRLTVLTYNDRGKKICSSNLLTEDQLDEAYGVVSKIGTTDTQRDKLLYSQEPIKHVRNYLNNSGFEDNIIMFQSQNANLCISDECSFDGNKSLKVNFSENGSITQHITVPKGNYYTFSAYIRNTKNIKISLKYENSDGIIFEQHEDVYESDNFIRHDVTLYYPEEALGDLLIQIDMSDEGLAFFDNIQLEKGEVANAFNYIYNDNFSNGLSDWNLLGGLDNQSSFEVVNLSHNNTALKIKMDVEESTSIQKRIKMNGKKDDEITVSFWYKNQGIVTDMYNSVVISFNYINEDDIPPYDFEPQNLNINEEMWQYCSLNYTALADYDEIIVDFMQINDANDLYITNVSVFKGVRNTKYDYNLSGDIDNKIENNSVVSNFKYDNNQNIVFANNSNSQDLYIEYDNNIINMPLKTYLKSGLSNEIKVDDFGQIKQANVKNHGFFENLKDGIYLIRLKGTDKYINYSNKVCLKNNDLQDRWYFEKTEDGYFKIKHSILNDLYLCNDSDVLKLTNLNNNSLFEIVKNDNGSFIFKNATSEKYLKASNEDLVFDEYQDTNNYQFYIETVDFDKFMETNNMFSTDSNFVTQSVDTLLRKSYYLYDNNNSLITQEIDESGNVTKYDYNNLNKLSKISNDGVENMFSYYDNGHLKSIKQNDKVYTVEYDAFFNVTKVFVNDVLLITNVYEERNGNLLKKIYGNGNEIAYSYDNFDRVISITTMDNKYELIYGNNGDLLKVVDNNDVIKYSYDINRNILQYKNGDFIINYSHDGRDNITDFIYSLPNITEEVNHTYNIDSLVTNTKFGNINLNYYYDKLNRIIEENINNCIKKVYKYLENGKRTSLLIKEVNYNGEVYQYKYDKLNNITHIYHNSQLEKRYFYDSNDQVCREDDYILQETTRFYYDCYGNIVNRIVYNLNSYEFKYKNTYEYNFSWKDQLTKFNNNNISYDNIGNPLSYGNSILMSWKDGNKLASYIDSDNNLSVIYKYNENGIRTEKIVNNQKIQYYLCGDIIVFEKRDSNVIYYLRDALDDLIGMKYNENIYYYIKNNQDDIIGLMDETGNVVAHYYYDIFGKVVKIIDNDGNDLTKNSNHVANINPFRYRSYYYDNESGLYYLKSRYYNPVWGRFISPDIYIMNGIGNTGYNMYSYCNNNFINYVDVTGRFFGLVVVGALIAGGIYLIYKAKKTYDKNTKRAKEKAKTEYKNRVKSYSNTNLPNITSKVNQKLQQSKQEVREKQQNLKKLSDLISHLQDFINSFNDGGKYDLKNSSEWQNVVGYYNGILMEPQDIGNFHYGYIGRAYGFTTEILVIGAGIIQLKDHGSDTLENCLSESFCDDIRDTYFVKLGAQKYDEEHGSFTLFNILN